MKLNTRCSDSFQMPHRIINSTILLAVVTVILFFIFCFNQNYTVAAVRANSSDGNSSNNSLTTDSSSYQLKDEYAAMFSQNDITGWNPNECEDKGDKKTSGACGNTAKEIYWTTLQKYFDDPIKIAGIIGNLANEGGMNPTAWEGGPNDCEGGGINSSGSLISGWNFYYDGISTCTGVGAFGITSQLSKYLHTINDGSTGLIEYFKDTTSYSYNFLYHPGCSIDSEHTAYGDCLLEKIGGAEFSKLVEFEVKYAIEDFNPSQTQAYMEASFSTPSDAAVWWMDNWERPASRNPVERGQDAEKAYEELKDFVCTGGFSSSDITLIGDSISVYASSELNSKFPNSFLNMVGTRHPTKGGDCSSDGGGVSTLEAIISGTGTLPQQDGKNGSCQSITVNDSSLKNNIVWQLGTNMTGANESTVESVITKIGKDKKLFLVTPFSPDHTSGYPNWEKDLEKIAQTYRDVAKKHDNVYVVDWANAVKNNKSKYLVNEGSGLYVHPSDEGKNLLADLIATAVANANGGSSDGPSSTSSSSTSSSGESSTSNSSSSPEASSSTSGSSSGSVSGSDITWIGDSYSVFVDDQGLLSGSEQFSGVDIGPSPNNVSSSYIQGSKFVSSDASGNPSCLSILQKIIDSGKLRPYLVFACGTNGGWSDDDISKFQNLLKDKDTKAIVVNSRMRACYPGISCDPEFKDSNERLKAMADNNDNIILADWASAYKEEYYRTDPVHPYDNPGGEKWIGVISDALSGSDDCVTRKGDYPQYWQGGQSWSNQPYNDGNIGDSGCGPTSLAMILTTITGTDIFPDEVAAMTNEPGWGGNYVSSSGQAFVDLDKKVCEKYGCEAVGVFYSSNSDGEAKIRQYLNDGYLLHVDGHGPSPFSNVGHYVAVAELNGDNVLVLNPGHGGNKEWPISSISDNLWGGAFVAIKDKCKKSNGDICSDDGDTANSSHSGGFTSKEEAEKLIVKPYIEIAESGDPSNLDKYHIPSTDAGRTYYNCFAFSNYFISRYTTIDFTYVSGDGGGYAENFYNEYHDRYPELKLSTKPTPYSVAGCGEKTYSGPGSYSHTFIVLGVDESKGTMIYAEAGYGSTVVSANEISLTDPSQGSRNGSTGICHYTDFSKYLKGL